MSDEEGTRLQPTVLTGPQRALYDALSVLSPSLAAMYHGALQVLGQAGNPERHSQCAHSLRELMDKLSRYVDVPVKAQNERMADKVKALHPPWRRAKGSTCREANGSWSGIIDDILRKFLKEVEEFLDWELAHYPRRKDEAARVLRRVDVTGRRLPSRLEDLNVERWMAIRDYVIEVCHHKNVADAAEFAACLDELERFLLERLVPRTFDDFDKIDRLLREDDYA